MNNLKCKFVIVFGLLILPWPSFAANLKGQPVFTSYQSIASFTNEGDVNGDGLADIVIGVPDGGMESTKNEAGKVYIFYGQSFSGTTSLSEADVIISGQAGDGLGGAISLGDLNNDGFADLVLGVSRYQMYSDVSAEGIVYILYGSATLQKKIDIASADNIITGLDDSHISGGNVKANGDINGDGYDDIIFSGAEQSDELEENTYTIYGLYGSNHLPTHSTVAEADVVFTNLANNYGLTLATGGDVNADGIDDLIIGDWATTVDGLGDRGHGEVYLFYGSDSLPISNNVREDMDVTINGTGVFGYSLSIDGDVNGDQIDDILIGADNFYHYSEKYFAYGIYGSALLSPTIGAADADILFLQESDAMAAQAISSSGDSNGDGMNDIIIGYRGSSAASIFFGQSSFSQPLSFRDNANVNFSFSPLYDYEDQGDITQLSNAGDVDGDHKTDVLMNTNSVSAGLYRLYFLSSQDSDADGYPALAGDCMDNNSSIHPGMNESTIDHIDNDCDREIDEGYPFSVNTSGAIVQVQPQDGSWAKVTYIDNTYQQFRMHIYPHDFHELMPIRITSDQHSLVARHSRKFFLLDGYSSNFYDFLQLEDVGKHFIRFKSYDFQEDGRGEVIFVGQGLHNMVTVLITIDDNQLTQVDTIMYQGYHGRIRLSIANDVITLQKNNGAVIVEYTVDADGQLQIHS